MPIDFKILRKYIPNKINIEVKNKTREYLLIEEAEEVRCHTAFPVYYASTECLINACSCPYPNSL